MLQKLLSLNKDVLCEKSYTDVSVHRLLTGLLLPKEPGNLFDNLVTIAAQLQGIKKTLQPDENSRNTVVANLLRSRGIHALDQTLWGYSEKGESLGELDIKIEDETGRTISIIEALNLDSCDTGTIDRHVRKLFQRYDVNGLKENYILVYGEAKDFEGLCKNYGAHLAGIDYETHALKGKIEEIETGFNKVTAFRGRHRVNKGETVLYHILVEM